MRMTMRWYGADDKVTLQNIRQVPGMTGIVSALYDLAPGELWTLARLESLRREIEAAGLYFDVAESLPVHEAIKLALPERDRLIENYCQSLRHMGQVGVRVLCYNFMPIFNWTRTNLAFPMPDGSTTLSFDQREIEAMDLSQGVTGLPGWDQSYSGEELSRWMAQYQEMGEEVFFENLVYFLKAIVPVAEESGVLLAMHPDDPPWSILGLPRIIRDAATIQRMLDAVDHPYNGITFCTGSLGCAPSNDLPAMLRQFSDKIHFVHARNVKSLGDRQFREVEHPTRFGDVDMYTIINALVESGYVGPIRSDHGRMIWGETGRPGYGLYDRALGATYLTGLIESAERNRSN
ncbi:MAG: mannonate dehydratase [Anaerolineae bacterium]|nr:mannonate dehydratase [Anaerolineae bacterium]